ncbi:MAG: hypothetical protein LAT68_12100 [Cyclobacteriaceae bacterium]|nr:hypothetical protein [Cyclobacteriaceae bacterium]MCH8517059.1 hypothetical protein [Cyclobacteriaceae bacterium]
MYKIIFNIIVLVIYNNIYAQQPSITQVYQNIEEGVDGHISICTDCRDVDLSDGLLYYSVHENKITQNRGNYRGKLLHGNTTLYFIDTEQKHFQANFDEGLINGQLKEWLSDGTLLREEQYIKGIKEGKQSYYTFGELNTEEIYQSGNHLSTNYFHPDVEGVDYSIEYINKRPTYSTEKITYNRSIEGNIIAKRKKYEKSDGVQYNFYDGDYEQQKPNGTTEIVGKYIMNRKEGRWVTHYDERVSGIKVYRDDYLISETFYQEGKPFTGTAIRYFSDGKTIRESISVKNGMRSGATEIRPMRKNVAIKSIEYTSGLPQYESYEIFLSKMEAYQTIQLEKQCDGRGTGLYVSRLYINEEYTVVEMSFINNTLRAESSVIYTPSAGEKNAFNLLIDENKIIPLIKTFRIANAPLQTPLPYGEILSFVLVFESLPQGTQSISLVEGEEAYTINEEGNYIYNWGCFDLKL